MLTIYLKPGCPFCNQVLATLDMLELEYERKDVTVEGVAEELIEKGGKKQEPYLVDSDKDVAMYESDAIVSYLKETYGTDAPATSGEAKPRVHMSDAACTSCEG